MDQQTDQNAPTDESEPMLTLYRFCGRNRLFLDTRERSAVGVELSHICRERQIPLRKITERVGPRQWSNSRLYPEALLIEWLERYRKAQAETPPAQVSAPPATKA